MKSVPSTRLLSSFRVFCHSLSPQYIGFRMWRSCDCELRIKFKNQLQSGLYSVIHNRLTSHSKPDTVIIYWPEYFYLIQEQRCKFLQFTTGCSCLPSADMGQWSFRVQRGFTGNFCIYNNSAAYIPLTIMKPFFYNGVTSLLSRLCSSFARVPCHFIDLALLWKPINNYIYIEEKPKSEAKIGLTYACASLQIPVRSLKLLHALTPSLCPYMRVKKVSRINLN